MFYYFYTISNLTEIVILKAHQSLFVFFVCLFSIYSCIYMFVEHLCSKLVPVIMYVTAATNSGSLFRVVRVWCFA